MFNRLSNLRFVTLLFRVTRKSSLYLSFYIHAGGSFTGMLVFIDIWVFIDIGVFRFVSV